MIASHHFLCLIVDQTAKSSETKRAGDTSRSAWSAIYGSDRMKDPNYSNISIFGKARYGCNIVLLINLSS
ncbi:hypothetical protein SAMN05444159_1906 [Bradyrhizobium lablabi]|uniref:Uncharacterized protein n=1 Tax=Bradyrhizobium lablabi TaxID=722472 RepID=A0A1M6N9A5_9BRAD|nr:hypothetical protein SAMN05444159_1906 [Bradyrhizobium lablabi]